jgi:hypothetical protein
VASSSRSFVQPGAATDHTLMAAAPLAGSHVPRQVHAKPEPQSVEDRQSQTHVPDDASQRLPSTHCESDAHDGGDAFVFSSAWMSREHCTDAGSGVGAAPVSLLRSSPPPHATTNAIDSAMMHRRERRSTRDRARGDARSVWNTFPEWDPRRSVSVQESGMRRRPVHAVRQAARVTRTGRRAPGGIGCAKNAGKRVPITDGERHSEQLTLFRTGTCVPIREVTGQTD